MIAGPLSGLVLSIHSSFAGIISKSINKIESTRNLAAQLLAQSQKIKDLEQKLANSDMELTKLRQEARDTNNLRSLLGLKTHLSARTIAADVISRNPDNWFEQVTIDKGQSNKVQVGSAVITGEGVVGQIVSVSENASIVRLITDPDQKIGVVIKRINQPGVLSGQQKNPATIDFVPIGTPVEIGDKVVCLENGGIFPSEHPVGVVVGVQRDTNGTTLSIQVRPSQNFFDLNHVLIVPPTSDAQLFVKGKNR
jgi:rod shape-determining protein MreC